jgi:hypothetical protein
LNPVKQLQTDKHLRRSYSELFSSKKVTKHKKTQSEEDLFPSITVAAIKQVEYSSTDEGKNRFDYFIDMSKRRSY